LLTLQHQQTEGEEEEEKANQVTMSRVTRLGEFSPDGRPFTLGSFIKITKVAQNIELLFSLSLDYVLIMTKICWATFWAIFPHTHLVTLPLGCHSYFNIKTEGKQIF
jgi:hypothetical protein